MGRKKLAEPKEVLTKHVSFRVNQADWLQLERLRKQSDCRTIGEVVRRILSKREIVYFHKDASMDAPMEALSSVREELRRIGININQVTRYFNSCKSDLEKNSYGIKVAELFASVEPQVKILMNLIAQMSRRWLQK
jgi:MobC-like protein